MSAQEAIILHAPQACFSRGGEFPEEIIAEFTEYLSVDSLLNLSLASRSLRNEAQRVLFRSIDRTRFGGRPGSKLERDAHILFLQAIVNARTRLGPHVRSYSSRGLALVSAHSDQHKTQYLLQSDDEYWRTGCELWNLTFRALPLFTQLKHLTLFLGTDWKYTQNGSEPSPFRGTCVLRKCHFKLDSFAWGETHGLQNGVSDLKDFLSRQPNLRLLKLHTAHRSQWYSNQVPPIPFAPNVLPSLRRIIGPPSILQSLLSVNRDINTVFWLEPWHPADPMFDSTIKVGLQKVKCLSLSDTSIPEILVSSLTSVETLYFKQVPPSWQVDMSQLAHFRVLRILIVKTNPRYIANLVLNPNDPTHNTPQTNPALQIAATAFEICANTLQSVHFPVHVTDGDRMLSVAKSGRFQLQKLDRLWEITQPLAPSILEMQSDWESVEDYL